MNGFDRFAAWCSSRVAKPFFFAFCVLLILLWAPSIVLLRSVDTWQLIINTATTIITFLMVALLQNSGAQDMNALHFKLDRFAEALMDIERVDQGKLFEIIGAEKEIGA